MRRLLDVPGVSFARGINDRGWTTGVGTREGRLTAFALVPR